MSNNASQMAAFIWSVADLLRGDFKQSQYGRIILPFTLLRRLECVLESTKDAVLVQAEKVQAMNLPEETQEKMILRATVSDAQKQGLVFLQHLTHDACQHGAK